MICCTYVVPVICIFVTGFKTLFIMASIKVVLRKKKNKEGLYPIAIRVIKDRKSSFLYTGKYIDLKDWDGVNLRVKKSHPNHSRLNNLILKKLSEINDKLLELETNNEAVSAKVVKKHFKKEIKQTTFFQLAGTYLSDLQKAGKHSRYSADKPRITHFKKFLKNIDIDFVDITVPLLKKFKIYLKQKRKITDRTIVNYLVVIRTIFNMAIREEIVDRRYYPFGRGKMVLKFPETIKLGLSKEEVKELERLNFEKGSSKWHALNMWLFSFYFAGIRVSDILELKWSDFDNGRLHYTMGKNAKVGSLKIPIKAMDILEQYECQKDQNNGFVFPEFKNVDIENKEEVYRRRASANKKFNKYLKQIAEEINLGKPLTMHIARHTFGNISGDKIPVQMLQKLYRHSSITTTINYQSNFVYKDEDEALDAVISF